MWRQFTQYLRRFWTLHFADNFPYISLENSATNILIPTFEKTPKLAFLPPLTAIFKNWLSF